MKLYLVQHGNCNPKEVDPEKNLSEKGKNDVKKIAEFLKVAEIKIPKIYHSTKVRAKQTAEILAPVVQAQNIAEKENIAPLDPVDPLKEESEKREKDLMVVGHLPYLEKLASSLLTGDENSNVIQFQQGGILCLENTEGKWRTSWMVIPKLL